MTEHPHPHTPTLNVVKIPAHTYKPIEFLSIGDNLQAFRDLIGGGYIEVVRNRNYRMECGCHLVMVVDEEGLLKDLPDNLRATEFYPYSRITGDVFFVAEGFVLNADGEEDMDFVSLPDHFKTWQGPSFDLPTP